MIAGKARCLDVPSGFTNLTLNAEYPLVSMSASPGTTSITIIDDDGAPYSTGLGGGFELTELYAMVKVI